MFYTTQRTLYGIDLALAKEFGKEYVIHTNTTLNEKLQHLTKEQPPQNTYPTLKYYCIGTGGNATIVEPGKYPYSPHSPLDAALFNMIPFVMVPKDQDIDVNERSKYRLRVERLVQGKSYICYYLKAIDLDTDVEYKAEFSQVSHRGDLDTIDPINLDEKDPLNPKIISKVGKVISTNSSYVLKKAKITISLSPDEIQKIKNAIDILSAGQQGVNYKITEIGLCTGIDKVVNNMVESLCTQISYHISPDIDLLIYLNTATSIYRSYELGGTEPIYAQ